MTGSAVTIAPTPDPVPKLFSYGAQPAIKIATSNLFIENDTLDIDYMTGLIFEDIGAMELSNIVRYDSINTTQTVYAVVSNINLVAQQIKLDFNSRPSTNTSIYLNNYIDKSFLSNIKIFSINQTPFGPGTTSYRTFYVNKDLSNYNISNKLKVTISGIGTVGGVSWNVSNVTVIETGNGYFKTFGVGVYSGVKQKVATGLATFSDYVPVSYESALYDNGNFNKNYSNITIDVAENYKKHDLEVQYIQYQWITDAEV
jgi:hypothetical protein